MSNKVGRNDICPKCGQKMKHCKGHWFSGKGLVIIIIIIVVVIGVATARFIIGSRPHKNVVFSHDKQSDIVPPSAARPYIERIENGILVHRGLHPKEEDRLWDDILSPVIGAVTNCRTPHAVINEKLGPLLRKIKDRYGEPFRVRPVDLYDLESIHVMCVTALDDGHPTVFILLPAQLDVYEMYKKSSSAHWDIEFRNEFMVGFIHETFHLLHDNLRELGADMPHQEALMAESRAWSLTCEEIMRPLVENHQPLGISNRLYYHAWLKAGRDQSNKGWLSSIARGTPQ